LGSKQRNSNRSLNYSYERNNKEASDFHFGNERGGRGGLVWTQSLQAFDGAASHR
jgi:hypothetical protein